MKSIITTFALLFFVITKSISAGTYTVDIKQYGSYQISCSGLTDGEINVAITSGPGLYQYDLYRYTVIPAYVLVKSSGWTSNTSHKFDQLPAGLNYFIVVRFNNDENNALAYPSFNLDQPTPIVAGGISGISPICFGDIPAAITTNPNPSGGNGAWTYEWDYSDNCTGTWTKIVGATNYEYSETANLNTTRCYRRMEKNFCDTLYSTTTIAVRLQLQGGAINPPAQATICYNTAPSINGGTAPSGGSETYNYQWQYQTNCTGAWADVGGATAANLTNAPNLTARTCFRRRVVDPTCADTAYSNTQTVDVYGELKGGKIGTSKFYCSGSNPDPVTNIDAASGGYGAASYRWQYTTNLAGAWIDGGINYLSYDFSNNITQTTYLRRKYTNSCGTVYSDTVTFTVPKASITVIKGLTCYDGNDGQLQANLTGSTPVSYNWYGGNPAKSRGTNPIATDLEQGIYYVTITDNVGCNNAATVYFVYSQQPTSIIPPLLTVSATSTKTCSKLNNGSITVTAGGGEVAYQYAVARTGIDSIGAQAGNVFSTLYNGNYKAWVIDNRGCRKFIPITVDSTAAPIANAGADQNTCVNKPITITGTASNYSSLQWTVVTGNGSLGSPTTLTPTYTPAGTDAGTTVRLRLTANGSGNCNPVTDDVDVVITSAPTANAGTDQTTCVNKPITITGTATNYSSLQWTVVTGTGVLTNGTTLTPTYTPVPGDAGTTVVLRLQVNGNSNCDPVTDNVNIT
ncbi:MAG TPA: hypothetical protein VHO72_04665, partial [Bacteroidales bacterium]|nr:hypothetical protein [Bacteroidales bacterium]